MSELLASGYRTEAQIIAHSAEVDARKLYLVDASENLFAYCTGRLGLSNSEAFHRMTAARIARRYPIVFTLIEQRHIHLSGVCLLRDYLTPQNHGELLQEACHKTKWQIQELLARRFPRASTPSRIRKLPTPITRSGLSDAGASNGNLSIKRVQGQKRRNWSSLTWQNARGTTWTPARPVACAGAHCAESDA